MDNVYTFELKNRLNQHRYHENRKRIKGIESV